MTIGAGPATAVGSAVTAAPTWWRRPGLDIVDDRLSVDGADLEALVREHGTPLFVYDLARPIENVRRLQAALEAAGVRHVVRFALKACPAPRILAVLRGLGPPGAPGSVGIDACSPGEVVHALANGWMPEEISHTGTNVSERDLDVLLAHPIRLNLDGVSQLERVGPPSPGRAVGIRVNPGVGAGYTEHLAYAGDRPTKFGVAEDRLDDAIAAARRHALVVDTLHFHAGSGWLGDQLDRFEGALGRACRLLDRLLEAGLPVREVNVGGGLGRVARQGEVPVDLDAYAAVVARHLGPYGVTVAFEPGDLVMKDAGVLLGEVVSVEQRGGTTFVGLDIGWNVNCAWFIYRYAQEIVPVRQPLRERTRLGDGGRAHQRGGRRVRRGLPVPGRGRGRGRRHPQRGRLPPGDVDDPLPAAHRLGRLSRSGAGPVTGFEGLVEVPAADIARRPGVTRPTSRRGRSRPGSSGAARARATGTGGTWRGGPARPPSARPRRLPNRSSSRARPWRRTQASRCQSSSQRSTSSVTVGRASTSRTRASASGSASRFGFSSTGVYSRTRPGEPGGSRST